MQPGVQPGVQQQAFYAPGPSRGMGTLAHLGGSLGWIIAGPMAFLIPMISYLVKNGEQVNRDELELDHMRQASNASITIAIASIVHGALMLLLVGFLTMAAHWVCYLVWSIQANSAMKRGEQYQYPLTIQFF